MKTKSYFLLLFILSAVLFGCNDNDPIGDQITVGQMAPQVYWDVQSSTVSAGNSVPFSVQYYTTSSEPISHLEVWYSVREDIAKVVSCPWTVTFSYSFSAAMNEQKRISQPVCRFEQENENWSDSLHAFSFVGTFPTSSTLSAISWNKPEIFDSLKMVSYFGDTFMQEFKDSLYSKMKFEDFQKMYTGLGLVDDFKVYKDSTFNENTGGWDYHFPNHEIPVELSEMYNHIPFSDLIFNSSNGNYEVEYNCSYLLDAVIKCFDVKGVAGTSLTKEITLN